MNPLSHACVALAVTLAAQAAHADVSLQAPGGFTITQRRATAASGPELVAAIGQVGAWWGDTHTYSNHAANMQLELQAGGCFCERWSSGSVAHARVIYVDREAGIVRLAGALGPLQALAVEGVLTFSLQKTEGRNELVVTYRIGGADAATLEHWPAGVDRMIGETTDRLARYLSDHR